MFSKTAMNGYWQDYFPKWKVFEDWKPGVIRAIMAEQAEVVKHWRKHPDSINPYRLIILDDVVTEAGKSKELEDLAVMGRHYKICIMLSDQHPQLLGTAVRSNSDISVIFRIHEEYALETLAHNYLPTLNEQIAKEYLQRYCVKDKQTGEAQCLIIANRFGNTLTDRVFYLTAPDPGPFKLGCVEYWRGEDTSIIHDKDGLPDLFDEERTRDENEDSDGDGAAPGVEDEDSDADDVAQMKLDPRVKRIFAKGNNKDPSEPF